MSGEEEFRLLLFVRTGRFPCEMDELLTADEYGKLIALARKHPAAFWGLSGI